MFLCAVCSWLIMWVDWLILRWVTVQHASSLWARTHTIRVATTTTTITTITTTITTTATNNCLARPINVSHCASMLHTRVYSSSSLSLSLCRCVVALMDRRQIVLVALAEPTQHQSLQRLAWQHRFMWVSLLYRNARHVCSLFHSFQLLPRSLRFVRP